MDESKPIQKTPPSPSEIHHVPDDGAEKFNAWDPKILQQIDALVDLARPALINGDEDNRDLVRNLIVTSLQAEYARLDRGDLKILSRSLREFRYGFTIFKPYRNKRKVTIFGSARTAKDNPEYQQALHFAEALAAKGYMTITGAGPGIMEAGNVGAGIGNTFGINIRLPFEQKANQYIADDARFVDCRFFFTRKLMFLKETSAVAFFPGGYGTHDEAFETLTLVQTGKADPMPLVFVDAPGDDYWTDWLGFIKRQLLDKHKISPEDMSLFTITDSIDKAVAEITHFYSNYHSLRFVKDQLVIRMEKGLSAGAVESINRDFKDICIDGGYALSQALPEERGAHPNLPRLVFHFNRLNFGRLRQLIDRINGPLATT